MFFIGPVLLNDVHIVAARRHAEGIVMKAKSLAGLKRPGHLTIIKSQVIAVAPGNFVHAFAGISAMFCSNLRKIEAGERCQFLSDFKGTWQQTIFDFRENISASS